MTINVIEQVEILMLHDMILSISPGRPGILHSNQLEAALQRPFTYAQYKEVTVHTIAALIVDSFARNHAFNDGNKRTAVIGAIYTYAINSIYLKLNSDSNKQFEELVLWVVREKPEIKMIEQRLTELVRDYRLKDHQKFAFHLQNFFISKLRS